LLDKLLFGHHRFEGGESVYYFRDVFLGYVFALLMWYICGILFFKH